MSCLDVSAVQRDVSDGWLRAWGPLLALVDPMAVDGMSFSEQISSPPARDDRRYLESE
jgi:hypothetical protein